MVSTVSSLSIMIVILIKRYNYFILKFCVAQQRRGIKQKRSGVEIELQIFVARGVVDPVFAHFYKKEEVNFAFKQFFQFPAGHLPDFLYHAAAFAENDDLLVVPFNINGLFAANRVVVLSLIHI